MLATVVGLGALVIDQGSKALVVQWFGPASERHHLALLGSLLAIEYVENTGAAFGILKGRTWLLSAAALGIVGWFVFVYGRMLPESRILQCAVGLILGGAVGNLIDRLRMGYVVDFIAVGPWPRFNAADSAITVGLLLLFVTLWRDESNGMSDT